MADLIIRVSGDATSYKKALEEAGAKTEDLNGQLESVAKGAAIAFALLTAEALASVAAYAESERALNKLTAALQQQGIFSEALVKNYQDIAGAIQLKTGADDDAVIAAMAATQGMLGQTKITQELAMAVADLAENKQMDLKSAFELVAKAATVNTGILKKQGIEVADLGDKEKNLVAITEALNVKFGGQAEAAAKGLGGIKLLKATFGDLQEEIGKRLAPAFELLITTATKVFSFIQSNPALLDFIVAAGVAAAAVSGIALAVAGGGIAFLSLTAALTAAGVATGAMTVATIALSSAAGIGLLIGAVTLIAMNWDEVWPRMQGVFQAFVVSITDMAAGVGKVLLGVFTGNLDLIKNGLAQSQAAVERGMDKYIEVVETAQIEKQRIEFEGQQKQDVAKKIAADAEAEKERIATALKLQLISERRQLVLDQLNKESAETIKLQQEEIALLEAMADEANEKIVGKLSARLARVRELQLLQDQEDLDRKQLLADQILAKNVEFEALSDQQKLEFMEKNKVALEAELLTENSARQAAALARAQIQTKENNDFLLNQQKFGTAYAIINKAMHSEAVTGASKAFGDLAALQSSSNSTLKAIGKVAAVANITIQTAQAAMNIYTGFSTIPIIGPALGIAGAAAAVAFGAERMGQVTAAADGGLLEGGIAGRDSIPVLGMPGELVVPTRNFDEVVGAVSAARSGSGGQGAGAAQEMNLILTLKDDLMNFIEAKLVERTNLNISIQGA